MSIYTNGVLMATKTGMTPFVRGTYDLHIGGSSNYFSYNGRLDEFRVWNVARTQAQIQSDLGVLSITHKFGFLVHDRFDFVADVERDVHGALARASRRSVSMSLCSLR